jgi:predicted ATP-dependent endonuclease of OLD family
VLFEVKEELIESDLDEEVLLHPSGRVVRRKREGPQWNIDPPLPKGTAGQWAHRYLPTSRLIFQSLPERVPFEMSEDFYDSFFARELERHWNEFFGGVQSEVRRIQEQGIANILAEMLSAKESPAKTTEVDWEKAYERATAFLKRQKLTSALPARRTFQERFKESPVLQRVVERIDALEDQIARAMEARTKLQSLVERLFSGNKRLVLGDTSVEVHAKNDVKIGLQSLSSGEKHILRILFEALRAGPSSLIIDEPEISLHIDWQRELIKALRELNPKCQLIVATHSPEVMAEIDNSKIFAIPA